MEEDENLIPKQVLKIYDNNLRYDKPLARRPLANIKQKNKPRERYSRSNDSKHI